MNAPEVALIVLACVCASAMFGLWLQSKLPKHHLATETKEIVRLVTGLIATISALVLSLLIPSANASYERGNEELI